MPSYARSLLSSAAVLTLAGCATVGPDYRAPGTAALQTTGTFRAAASVDARPASPADLATWWTGFDDPVLTRIVGRVAGANLDIAAARARLDQAAAGARLAIAQRLPAIGANASVGIQRQSLETGVAQVAQAFPGFDRTGDAYAVGTSASWELDLFGGLRRGREAAFADADAARAGVAGARVAVIAEAADAYLQVRLLQRRLAVLREQIGVSERLNRLVDLRFAAGIVARQETDRTDAQLQQFRAALPLLDALLSIQMNRLDVLMGAAPGTYRDELTRPRRIPVAPGIITAGGPVALLRRRPDLLVAERRLAAANARIGEQIAEYYPKLSLGGSLGFDALSAGRLLTGDAAVASGLLGLRWRLFDFGRIDAAVEASRGREREALVGYRLSVLRALEDVENAFSTLVRREAQARALGVAEASLLRARQSVRAGYAGGVISLVEVLDVERQLLITQDDLAQAQGESSRAAVTAFRALGGGWS